MIVNLLKIYHRRLYHFFVLADFSFLRQTNYKTMVCITKNNIFFRWIWYSYLAFMCFVAIVMIFVHRWSKLLDENTFFFNLQIKQAKIRPSYDYYFFSPAVHKLIKLFAGHFIKLDLSVSFPVSNFHVCNFYATTRNEHLNKYYLKF